MSIEEINTKYKDIVIAIIDSNIQDEEKAEKIVDLITVEGWENLYICMKLNQYYYDRNLKRIAINYKYFKANGLLNKYKNVYKCSIKEAYQRLDILKDIELIVNSQISDDEKMSKLLKYYSSFEEFRKKYSLFIKFGEKDERLDKYRDVLNNYESIKTKVYNLYQDKKLYQNALYRNEIIKILEDNLYLENYLYAEWVIKNFIEYKRNYLKHEYINKIGINDDDFDYCIKLIQFLNPDLYQELQEETSNFNEKRMFRLDKTFLNLEHGIKYGTLFDGTPFNLLEFYRRVPFKNEGLQFRHCVFDFMQRIYGRSSSTFKTIGSYIYQNNIINMQYVTKEFILKNKTYINGVEITEQIVNDVFDYMEVNNLPKVKDVYRIILNQYLNNQIDLKKVQEKKAYYQVNSSNLVNPYKLVRKNKNSSN